MELTHELKNGLSKTTAEDLAVFKECMGSSVSLLDLWEDKNDTPKILKWDKAWEEHLKHRASVIDSDGRERYLPWNAYNELGLDWEDGYGFAQKSGDCVSFGHRNSLKTSNFSNALRTGKKPKEIANSMTYALCRGNGTPNFGSGANLIPMAKYAAEYGNFWTEDFGRYNTGGYCSKYKKGSEQDTHAKKTQSIIVFLPKNDFETCWKVVRAGYGICIGTSIFIGSSKVNEDGLARVSSWDSGAHCTSIIAGWEGDSGTRYLYNENSHPTKYASDKLNPGHQWGCWLTEEDLNKMVKGSADFGTWYVNIGELGG